MTYDHKAFFDSARDSLFSGELNEGQVNGMEAILTGWETHLADEDPRFLAYMLATTYHETAQTMLPIEEYGKGAGQPYGEPDPETGQTYYGRGFIMTTWRENYARTDRELGLSKDDSTEWHADNMLIPSISARGMWFGMSQGWYRADDIGPQTLKRWFNDQVDDPFWAREIINGDKNYTPDWASGNSIGTLIENYHWKFLSALDLALQEPQPEPAEPDVVEIAIGAPTGVRIAVSVNGFMLTVPPET